MDPGAAPVTRAPVEELEERLGHRFRDPARLERALVHASHAHENPGLASNERLEFLGDAVLDLVIGHRLFRAHPEWSEGELTRARSALVRTESLAARARELGLGPFLRLSRSEARSGGSNKTSILAGALEAVLGAIYLDGGLPAVERLVDRVFPPAPVDPGSGRVARDPKTAFQEWAHAAHRESPNYRVLEDSGLEEDEARFLVEVRVGEEAFGRGRGRTKRAAERRAAESALERVGPRGG